MRCCCHRNFKTTSQTTEPEVSIACTAQESLGHDDASGIAMAQQQLCFRLRELVHDCLQKQLLSAAIFYADKLTTLQGEPDNVLLLAQVYFTSKQHRRALQLLRRDGLVDSDMRFKHLAACCLLECKQWEECLALLGDEQESASSIAGTSRSSSMLPEAEGSAGHGSTVSLVAALHVVRARAFEALNNRPRAKTSYQAALQVDAYCYDAFAALIESHMLSCEEEAQLTSDLAVHPQDRWLKLLLRAKCKKYNLGSEMPAMLAELEAPLPPDEVSQPSQPTATAGSVPQDQEQVLGLPQPAQSSMAEPSQAPRTALTETQNTPLLFRSAPKGSAVGPLHEKGSSARAALFMDTAGGQQGDDRVQGRDAAAAGSAEQQTQQQAQQQGQQQVQQQAQQQGQQVSQQTQEQVWGGFLLPSSPLHSAEQEPSEAVTPSRMVMSESSTSDMEADTPAMAQPSELPTPSAQGQAYTSEAMQTTPGVTPWHMTRAGVGTPQSTAQSRPMLPAPGRGKGRSSEQSMQLAYTSGPSYGRGMQQQQQPVGSGSPQQVGMFAFQSPQPAMSSSQAAMSSTHMAVSGLHAAMSSTQAAMSSIRASMSSTHATVSSATAAQRGSLTSAGQTALPRSAPGAVHGATLQPPVQQGGYGCGLAGNVDVQACRADWLFHRGLYDACYSLTSSILQSDCFALQVLPLHIASACVLGRQAELFQLGHQLTEQYPDKALSWYAVGCYYMCTRQHDMSRRYLSKATALEQGFAPAWIAYGHAFSALDERDQAMSAYRTAFRLFPGLHLPLLGMGMEYAAMNNLQLAERMLLAAHELCPADPATCHELGVTNARNGLYNAAGIWLRHALRLAAAQQQGTPLPAVSSGPGAALDAITVSALGPRWEPSVVALAHCLRKQGHIQSAVQWYRVALGMVPSQPATMSALGMCLQMQGNVAEALQMYHQSMALRPDDQFTNTMLNIALVEYASQTDIL